MYSLIPHHTDRGCDGCYLCPSTDTCHVVWYALEAPCPTLAMMLENLGDTDVERTMLVAHVHVCPRHGHVHLCEHCYQVEQAEWVLPLKAVGDQSVWVGDLRDVDRRGPRRRRFRWRR